MLMSLPRTVLLNQTRPVGFFSVPRGITPDVRELESGVRTRSVELRTDAGERVVCEWGPISGVSTAGGVFGSIADAGPLILIADDLRQRAVRGPVLIEGVLTTYAVVGGREFVTVEADSGARIYELFECHWWDGGGPRMFLGKWPD